MNADELLNALVNEWLSASSRGQKKTPEELCAQCPELLDLLKKRIAALESMEQFLDEPNRQVDNASTGPVAAEDDTPWASPAPTGSPRLFGAFEILRKEGGGGMGLVYLARHQKLGHTVALKVMRDDANPSAAQRFLVEARAMASLSHPNILPLYEFGEENGYPYFTMPFLPKGSLADERLTLTGDCRRIAALIERVARAIHHAHTHGVIHRDLKPANILLVNHRRPTRTHPFCRMAFAVRARVLEWVAVVAGPLCCWA
jgi:serine/threonine protein kinase